MIRNLILIILGLLASVAFISYSTLKIIGLVLLFLLCAVCFIYIALLVVFGIILRVFDTYRGK